MRLRKLKSRGNEDYDDLETLEDGQEAHVESVLLLVGKVVK